MSSKSIPNDPEQRHPASIVGGFAYRSNLAPFLHGRGLGPGWEGVEVGTHRGEFAVRVLETWAGSMLYCVDHWKPNYDAYDPAALGDRSEDKRVAAKNLFPFAERVTIVEGESVAVANTFKDRALAFVYLDGCHQYQSVLDDLRAWWPKVTPGGILAGHDIICTGEYKGGWGATVQVAALDFGAEIGLPVHLVPETDGQPWSYYFSKPGSPPQKPTPEWKNQP